MTSWLVKMLTTEGIALRAALLNDVTPPWPGVSCGGGSLIATTILRRPFLPGDDGPWAESRRVSLAGVLLRALDCRVDALVANGELKLALTHAQEAARLEPYRESGYRRLMRLHAQNGDRAEAIRVFLECKRLLELELGVAPSAETQTLYRELAD